MRDLLARIDDRGKPGADIEEGYHSTTACILANLSQELGRSLATDDAKGEVSGDDEANGLLARPYSATLAISKVPPQIIPRPTNSIRKIQPTPMRSVS